MLPPSARRAVALSLGSLLLSVGFLASAIEATVSALPYAPEGTRLDARNIALSIIAPIARWQRAVSLDVPYARLSNLLGYAVVEPNAAEDPAPTATAQETPEAADAAVPSATPAIANERHAADDGTHVAPQNGAVDTTSADGAGAAPSHATDATSAMAASDVSTAAAAVGSSTTMAPVDTKAARTMTSVAPNAIDAPGGVVVPPDEHAAAPGAATLAARNGISATPTSARTRAAASPRLRVLVLGDSMLEAVYLRMKLLLKGHRQITLRNAIKYSTGLVRIDYYDWTSEVRPLLAQHRPDIVLIMMGGNDGQYIEYPSGTIHPVGSESWVRLWAERAGKVVQAAQESGAEVWWLRLPVMRYEAIEAARRASNAQLVLMTQRYPNLRVLASDLLMDPEDGSYQAAIPDPRQPARTITVRYTDGIHFNEGGARLLAEALANTLVLRAHLPKLPAPETPALRLETLDSALPAGWPTENPPMTVDTRSLECTSIDAPRGAHSVCRHLSKLRGKEVAFAIWGPPRPGPHPLVVLLHGAFDGYDAWGNHAAPLLTRLADEHNVYIATPDGEPFGWWLDSPQVTSHRLGSYVTEEFIPMLRENFEIADVPPAITGNSMGGHGALTLAMEHPGAFTAAGSMSGVLDLPGAADALRKRDLPDLELATLLGERPDALPAWEAHSALHLLRKRIIGQVPPMIVSSGGRDFYSSTASRALGREARARGFDVVLEMSAKDGHTWQYWMDTLPVHIAFFAERFNRAQSAGTPAEQSSPEAGGLGSTHQAAIARSRTP